jgi:hypothetical protein
LRNYTLPPPGKDLSSDFRSAKLRVHQQRRFEFDVKYPLISSSGELNFDILRLFAMSDAVSLPQDASEEVTQDLPRGLNDEQVSLLSPGSALATQPPIDPAVNVQLNIQISQLRHTNSELQKRLHVALVSGICGIRTRN